MTFCCINMTELQDAKVENFLQWLVIYKNIDVQRVPKVDKSNSIAVIYF